MRPGKRSSPSAIRIGYCIDSFDIGGTELNAVRTVEALDLERFALTVFHLHVDGPIRSRYEALGVRLVHLPISGLRSPRTLAQGLRLAHFLRKHNIAILHAHDLYTNIVCVPLGRLLGGCQVIASRRWLFEAPRTGLIRLNRWSYRFANRVLANSAAVKQLLIREEGVPARKIFELPNFLEEAAFRRVDRVARLEQRRQWNIPNGAFVVGIVARLVAVKNHELLLKAVALLDEQVHVVLIGDGGLRGALEQLAQDLGIHQRVHFMGQVLPRLNPHQFFEVSVLCSHSEGFPNSVIEALAAERPVIATPVGGVTDIVVENVSGLLVPTSEPQTLANRIQSLRADPELGGRLGAAGLARVRAEYHQSVIIARLGALYRELALAS